MTWSTVEASKATGIPESSLRLLVAQGLIRPAVCAVGAGRGRGHEFDEKNLNELRAVASAREAFGAGTMFYQVVSQIPQVVRPGTVTVEFAVQGQLG